MDNKQASREIESHDRRFSLADQRLYPYLKLTNEKFPRLLVTRKIADDGAEYFGAFLPETGVRFLIDFLNKTFRLRSCEIDIDGQFDVPCTQFYRQRCVAPCVASLCDEKKYNETVELVRFFLRKDKVALDKRLLEIIENYAHDLNYEKAGEWRDRRQAIDNVLSAKNWNFWLDDAVDTFEVEETNEKFLIYLITMRGRKSLGKRVFSFQKNGTIEELLLAILSQMYCFYAPKEIRVSHDFSERLLYAEKLSVNFGRRIKIVVINEKNRKIITERAARRARFENEFKQLQRRDTLPEIQTKLRRQFDLPKNPTRIEAFDVAHISGKDFVAAKSVWENGKFIGKEYEFEFSDKAGELEVLQQFIEHCFRQNLKKSAPDLILIDGGTSHLKAALKGLTNFSNRSFSVISAVKPLRRHEEISYFLTESGERIDFDNSNSAHGILRILRDEAHNLSNQIHRLKREMSHFYELAKILPSFNESERLEMLKKFGSIRKIIQIEESNSSNSNELKADERIRRDLKNFRQKQPAKIEPLIVPLRFDDENGDARNLQPLAIYKNAEKKREEKPEKQLQ